MSKETQLKLPIPISIEDARRDAASASRSTVYNHLQEAAAEARQAGDLDAAKDIQMLISDAPKVPNDLWLDIQRVMARSSFDTSWWMDLVKNHANEFNSLGDMILTYLTDCDARNQTGETRALDDRLFPKLAEERERYWDKRAEDHRRRSVERYRQDFARAGRVVPSEAEVWRKLEWDVPSDE